MEKDLYAHQLLNKVIEHESNPQNLKYYNDIAKFYGKLKGADKESLIWNELWRYYVFKKT
jgi:hypothetical protein